jgi:hypothetical protein
MGSGRLDELEVPSRFLTALAIVLKLKADFLTFLKVAHSCSLNCGNVDEHVLAAVVRLNESEALGSIEPFDLTGSHVAILSVGEGCFIADALAGNNSDSFEAGTLVCAVV